MSELRGLRCTPETYQIVAWYAGKEGLSLCESLDRLVKTSALLAKEAKAAVEMCTTEPENDTKTDPWAGWEDFFNHDPNTDPNRVAG